MPVVVGSCTRSRCRSPPVSWSPSPAAAVRARPPCSRPWPASAGRSRHRVATTAFRPVRREHGPDIGFVPQDDIIHRELPLRTDAALCRPLRLPAGTARPTRSTALVDETLETSSWPTGRRRRGGPLRAGSASGRASAVELLTRPRVLFLDEPTSGLDPATAPRCCAVAPPTRRTRRHRGAHHPRSRRHRQLRPGRLPRPRRVTWPSPAPPTAATPLLRRHRPRPGLPAASPTRTIPELWAERFASRRDAGDMPPATAAVDRAGPAASPRRCRAAVGAPDPAQLPTSSSDSRLTLAVLGRLTRRS